MELTVMRLYGRLVAPITRRLDVADKPRDRIQEGAKDH